MVLPMLGEIPMQCLIPRIGARTLLGAPGLTTRSILTTSNKTLLGAPGIATRSDRTLLRSRSICSIIGPVSVEAETAVQVMKAFQNMFAMNWCRLPAWMLGPSTECLIQVHT